MNKHAYKFVYLFTLFLTIILRIFDKNSARLHTGTGVFRPAYGRDDRKGKGYIPGGAGYRESEFHGGDREPVLQPG